jgi:GWxTD domain-containing protein
MRRPALLAALCLLVALGSVSAKERKSERLEDLMNPLLGPDYSLWLVGPIGRLATKDEVERFKRLTNDAEARAFVEQFWANHDPDPQFEGNSLRERFEERAREADRKFGESGVPGWRSDRGTTFILYGPPEEVKFDIAEHPDDPPVLVWTYPADAPKGLDGKPPERSYRFIRRGDVTVFFTPNTRPPRPRLDRPGPP